MDCSSSSQEAASGDDGDEDIVPLVVKKARISSSGPTASSGSLQPSRSSQMSDRPSSSGEQDSGDSGKSKRSSGSDSHRRRVNKFDKIRPGQRCGKCENCLNPQRKQACKEARKKQIAAAMKGQNPTPKAVPRPTPKADASSPDPFMSTLSQILTGSGGVTCINHLPQVLDLIKRAKTKGQQTAMAMVLTYSTAEVQKLVVENGVLPSLQTWLEEAILDRQDTMIGPMLSALEALPITLDALADCEIAKVVNRLRKVLEVSEKVRKQGQELVAKWKKVVGEQPGPR
jgi:hypothetical protein